MSNGLSDMNLPRYPLLGDNETRELIIKAQAGDGYAREKLINCNLKLVFNLVKRFQNRGYELEDLFQVGCIGLVKAVDRFDPSYEVKFSTYAVPMVIGEIKRFLRDDGPVKVSRVIKETAYKAHQVREKLMNRLGREPSIGEVAEELNVSREEVVSALDAIQSPASIYEELRRQGDGEMIYLLDFLKSGGENDAAWLDRLLVEQMMEKLSEKEQKILKWRYWEGKTQADVAGRLGLSQVQVSRLERQAIKRLKQWMASQKEILGDY